jgi:cell division protein FtsI (penicillin-binding protein 3)
LVQLKKKLSEDGREFVWLKRQVDDEIGKQVAALKIKGVYLRKEYKRKYPEGDATATLVGSTSTEGKGIEGVEYSFQKDLEGKSGHRKVINDRLGNKVENVGKPIQPSSGKDVQLSIDSKIQFFAYQKIRDAVIENKAISGSVVVLDAQTGEILAAVSYPSNSTSTATAGGSSRKTHRNIAFSDMFEPGSAIKPFTIALALDKGLVKPDTVIQTAPGTISIGGSTIRDAHPHKLLTVEEVIEKSSNVGTVKVSLDLDAKSMWEMFSQAGFGQRPDIQFPGLASGRLRPYKTWRPIEKATMSYGYGLSASLFQITKAYSIFATDGRLIESTLSKRTGPAPSVQVISPETAKQIRKMLQMAASPSGTGQKAQTSGFSVGGKSGTAHKQEGKTYATDKYRSWFVGLSPIENPRIIVGVMLDEPSAGRYFGGDVAAPVFSETVAQALRTLGVKPDLTVVPKISSTPEPESLE